MRIYKVLKLTNEYLHMIIKSSGLLKYSAYYSILLMVSFFIFNGFTIDYIYVNTISFSIFGLLIFNSFFYKKIIVNEEIFCISSLIISFLTKRYNLNEIIHIDIHYNLKGRDIQFIRLKLINNKVKTIYIANICSGDAIKLGDFIINLGIDVEYV